MKWTELITSRMEENFAVTDNLMAMVKDEELGWKPATGDNWMTVGQLLLHLTTACGMCCKGFATGEWDMPEMVDDGDTSHEGMLPSADKLPTLSSVAQAREALAADKAVALAVVAEAGEEDLASRMVGAPWDPDETKALGRYMLEMVDHLGIHKAQLFYYLKLMGRPVNTMTLWEG